MSSPQVPNPAAASNSDTTKRFTPLVITIAVVIALVVVFFWFTNYYADYLWFDQLGFQGVLLTRWIASAVMFVIGFVAMAVPLYLVAQIAYQIGRAHV